MAIASTKAARYRFTILGGVVSLFAMSVWGATFAPHGGGELSPYLFPLWRWVCAVWFAGRDVPALLWFGGMLVHWPLLGAAIDVVRALRSRRWARSA